VCCRQSTLNPRGVTCSRSSSSPRPLDDDRPKMSLKHGDLSSVLQCAARRFHAEFAPWDQTRRRRVIRKSDAAAQFDSAIDDGADRPGSETLEAQ